MVSSGGKRWGEGSRGWLRGVVSSGWGEGSREWLRGGDGGIPGTVSGERLLVGLLGTHGVCRDVYS